MENIVMYQYKCVVFAFSYVFGFLVFYISEMTILVLGAFGSIYSFIIVFCALLTDGKWVMRVLKHMRIRTVGSGCI